MYNYRIHLQLPDNEILFDYENFQIESGIVKKKIIINSKRFKIIKESKIKIQQSEFIKFIISKFHNFRVSENSSGAV